MEWVGKKDLLWCVRRSGGIFAIRVKYKGAYTMHYSDMDMQLSHCIHVTIIFRWNSYSKEWIWEPFPVFVILEISLCCWTSAGSVSFSTSIMILCARPMVQRTFPVQDLIKNKTTDLHIKILTGWDIVTAQKCLGFTQWSLTMLFASHWDNLGFSVPVVQNLSMLSTFSSIWMLHFHLSSEAESVLGQDFLYPPFWKTPCGRLKYPLGFMDSIGFTTMHLWIRLNPSSKYKIFSEGTAFFLG